MKFKLSSSFIEKYKNKKAPFGFGILGELTYKRTYSRIKSDGKNEEWYETVERVVNGTYNMQKNWIEQNGLSWNSWQAQKSAQEMYDRIFNMKFLPPGRGLWAMGSPITEERGLFMSLNNCSFVSTRNIKEELSKPFCFLMDVSMLGVGCGFDTDGAGTIVIKGPNNREPDKYTIPDSREGWVESVKLLIESYFLNARPIEFDYSLIRPDGSLIKGFGGISAGERPLIELHSALKKILDKEIGQPISITTIVDIMNLIGKAVVSGNVRRTAEIVFGDPLSEEYLDLKNYEINPHRQEYGWTSNNSIFSFLGMDYSGPSERTKINGEPGYAWLENMRKYSRMCDPADNKDHRADGGNPCLEQTLESYEVCNLVETFPFNHESYEDYERTLKYAYLYAKTVTLGKTHWPETNRVMLRNRRIGCSISGIAQFIENRGIEEFKKWVTKGYDAIQKNDAKYSDWMAIPRSIKTTSIKPSGSVSLLVGSTPGMHWPEAIHYIRRMRIAKNSNLIPKLQKAGYNLLPAAEDKINTLVVEIPVKINGRMRSVKNVSMWEQLSLAAFLQKYWADNQVSCTVTFDPETEGDQIKHALNYFQYQLKGISFLPRRENVYEQMPYEEISEEKYNEMIKNIKTVNLKNISGEEAEVEKFCNNDVCEIKIK